ncbi:MAG: ABC transporter permease [Dehalococcoidia bacterium]
MAEVIAHATPAYATEPPRVEGPRHTALRKLVRNRPAVVGMVVIGVFGLLALLAPWVDRYDPSAWQGAGTWKGPSADFWLGTDDGGRDMYSRLVHGARISLTVGVLSQVIAVAIGLTVGLSAGVGGRWLDSLLMRLTDVAYAFPDLLMLIVLVTIMGSSMTMVVLAIGFVSWTTIARVVRTQALALRDEEFVLAARALGASRWQIARRHLLPNVLAPVIVTATFGVPAAIFAEAALVYIGVGLAGPSWGRIILESFDASHPEHAVIPCAVVALTMLSFTLIGDGLRDALDPRSSTRRALPKAEQARVRRDTPPGEERLAA